MVISNREAHLFFVRVTNHPVCADKEWDRFIEAQPPLLGKEGNVALRNRIQFIHSFYDRAWRRFFMSFATPSEKEGQGWLVKTRSHHVDVREAHLLTSGSFAAFIRSRYAGLYKPSLSSR